MIKQGDKISNPRTGQTMVFLKTAAETNGELLQIECVSPPTGVKEPEHIHPKQESFAKMISGSCTFSIDGKEHTIKAGETISIPPNVRHHFWNSGDTDAHYIAEFKPALTIDGFFASFFALAKDGKLSEKGMPDFFQVSLMGLKYKNDLRLINPPWTLQVILYWILAPFAFLMGYRGEYKSKK